MPGKTALVLAGLAGAATAAGLAYTAFAIARVRAFRTTTPEPQSSTEPVTIFKPLHGEEPHLYENLRSFCDQEYPRFQIIFGAADPQDPALETARRLQREFPNREVCVTAGEAGDANNPKVANLQGMWKHAKYDLLVIADSDIRVGHDYLRSIAAGFADERAGAVTCLYGGIPESTLACRLGAMHVNDHFAPSVLVASALEPLAYCFGATMAVRRKVLEQIGGLQSLAGNLGDDYVLGKLVCDAGYRVHLSRYVVQTCVTDRSLRALWLRELRWARTIYSSRPAGYAGSIVTYPLVFSALFALCAPSAITLGVFALAAALRVTLHLEGGKTFAPQVKSAPALVPLRDVLGAAVWLAGFFGRAVRWRGDRFEVKAGGHMAARDH